MKFEQAESLPAASVVRAPSCVVTLSGTGTPIPPAANAAGVPVAAGLPMHEAFVYSFTWVGDPAPVEPFTLGFASLEGEAGAVSVIAGTAGGVTSRNVATSVWVWSTVMLWVARPPSDHELN